MSADHEYLEALVQTMQEDHENLLNGIFERMPAAKWTGPELDVEAVAVAYVRYLEDKVIALGGELEPSQIDRSEHDAGD